MKAYSGQNTVNMLLYRNIFPNLTQYMYLYIVTIMTEALCVGEHFYSLLQCLDTNVSPMSFVYYFKCFRLFKAWGIICCRALLLARVSVSLTWSDDSFVLVLKQEVLTLQTTRANLKASSFRLLIVRMHRRKIFPLKSMVHCSDGMLLLAVSSPQSCLPWDQLSEVAVLKTLY